MNWAKLRFPCAINARINSIDHRIPAEDSSGSKPNIFLGKFIILIK